MLAIILSAGLIQTLIFGVLIDKVNTSDSNRLMATLGNGVCVGTLAGIASFCV